MSVSEISTLKTDRHRNCFRGVQFWNLVCYSICHKRSAFSAASPVRVNTRKNTIICWPIILSASNFWKHASCHRSLYNTAQQKSAWTEWRDRVKHTNVHTLTCRFWTALSHLRTRTHTPGQTGTGLCEAVHPPTGNTLVYRPADTLPAYLTRTTWFHPEKKRISKDQKKWCWV